MKVEIKVLINICLIFTCAKIFFSWCNPYNHGNQKVLDCLGMFTWLCVSPTNFFYHFENLQYNYHAQTRVWDWGSGPPQFHPLPPPPQKKKEIPWIWTYPGLEVDTPPPTLESFLDPGIITPILLSKLGRKSTPVKALVKEYQFGISPIS